MAAAAPVLYLGGIWLLSSFPADAVVKLGPRDSLIKEALHFVEFGLLYVLIWWGMRVNGVRPGQADQLAVLLAIAAALLDELHQSFVPLRSANWWDLTKDFIGIWLARELVVYIRRREKL